MNPSATSTRPPGYLCLLSGLLAVMFAAAALKLGQSEIQLRSVLLGGYDFQLNSWISISFWFLSIVLATIAILVGFRDARRAEYPEAERGIQGKLAISLGLLVLLLSLVDMLFLID